MIVPENRSRYTTDRKLIVGRGFVDSFSRIFSSLKPALNSVGSFIKQNKDLVAKPLLGAIGTLAATGISKGVPSIISHIMNRRQRQQVPPPEIDEKTNELLKHILSRDAELPIPASNFLSKDVEPRIPTTNIIGDGLLKKKRKTKKSGSGLKTF